MNQLAAQIEKNHLDIKTNELFLALKILIDGRIPLLSPEGDDFDVGELLSTVAGEKENTKFIFTCQCGFAGCAGYFNGIKVTQVDNEIVWVDQDQNMEYRFARVDYILIIKNVAKDILDWKNKSDSKGNKLRIYPDIISTNEVVEMCNTIHRN